MRVQIKEVVKRTGKQNASIPKISDNVGDKETAHMVRFVVFAFAVDQYIACSAPKDDDAAAAAVAANSSRFE